jgi:hypothetical protein
VEQWLRSGNARQQASRGKTESGRGFFALSGADGKGLSHNHPVKPAAPGKAKGPRERARLERVLDNWIVGEQVPDRFQSLGVANQSHLWPGKPLRVLAFLVRSGRAAKRSSSSSESRTVNPERSAGHPRIYVESLILAQDER